MPVPVLQIQGLGKRLGASPVLDGFSLAVAAGEIVGLLGPNGCGKSTVLNTVAQLLLPDAGVLQVQGAALGPRTRGLVALCAQEPALYPDLLPAENLDFFARLHGLSRARRQARVTELMQRFNLNEHAATRAGRLSGGWRQRLHLAVALVHEPALLLLDEPTAAVDVAARRDLWALIDGLRRSGMAIVLATHHLHEAERLCDRVALMRDGRVAAVGSVAELVARVPGEQVLRLRSTDAVALRHRVATLGWPARAQADGLCCLLPRASSLAAVIDALAGTGVTAADLQPVGLEQAYLETVGKPLQA